MMKSEPSIYSQCRLCNLLNDELNQHFKIYLIVSVVVFSGCLKAQLHRF